MGSEAEALTLQQWFGLVLAGIAMWVYNLRDELDADGFMVKGVNVGEASEVHAVRSVSLSRTSFASARSRNSTSRSATPMIGEGRA